MKIMSTSFKLSHACIATLRAPNPAAGHHQPIPPLETPRYPQASLGQSLVGSLLLSPGSWCKRFCLCPPRVFSPVLSSGSSMMGLMATSFKRFHAHTATHSASDPAVGHCQPTPPLETPRHSRESLGLSLVGSLPFSWVLVCTRFCLCPPRVCFPPVLCKFWGLYAGVNGNLLQ